MTHGRVQVLPREPHQTRSTNPEGISPQGGNLQPPFQPQIQEIEKSQSESDVARSLQQGAEIPAQVLQFVSNAHPPTSTNQPGERIDGQHVHPEDSEKDVEMGDLNITNADTTPTDDQMDVEDDAPTEDNDEHIDKQIRRSERQRHVYHPYRFFEAFGSKGGTVLIATANPDPLTYKEAVNGPDKFRWLEAILKEINSLSANNTWELVDLPKGRKLISSKWVFKKKYRPSGLIDKYKARLVARGFTQKHGIDYEETFAPTLRYESLRLLFSLCIKHGLRCWLLDVITAYLNGDLDKDIYMSMPEGIPRTKQNEGKVLHILKGLYGLKQSGRIWARKFRDTIQNFGFAPISADNCIFIKQFDKDTCLIALYVDDIVIATKRTSTYKKVKNYLTSSFKVTDSGPLTGILGIRITQDHANGVFAMDQTKYVESMLARHGMTDCNPVSTPIDGYDGIQPALKNEQRADQKEYQQLVGELMFLNIATRPDLSFAISKLSQFCTDPTVRHFNTLRRVLKYLRNTPNLGLFFNRDGCQPKYFTDAAYADDKNDRRSTYGYVMINSDAACVWYSRKQRSVATSTVEAEYLALSEGCKSSIWATRWINESGFDTERPIALLGDNSGSIALTKNPEHHARTKHIDVQYHYVREKVQEGFVRVEYVSTKDQVADIMTKPLTKQPFEAGRLKLGLHPVI